MAKFPAHCKDCGQKFMKLTRRTRFCVRCTKKRDENRIKTLKHTLSIKRKKEVERKKMEHRERIMWIDIVIVGMAYDILALITLLRVSL